jgi:hypothetical protein
MSLISAGSISLDSTVETGNNLYKTVVRLQLIFFSKDTVLAHFRSKVLVDFLHYITRINCLTGAITSETQTNNKYI